MIFFCLKCLHSFATESKCQSQKKVCENKDFCNIATPSENNKILEFNQYQESDKAQLIIYADLECLTEKIDGCKNNAKNSSTTKVCQHIPSDFSMSPTLSFKNKENKYDAYRGKDCMKNFVNHKDYTK